MEGRCFRDCGPELHRVGILSRLVVCGWAVHCRSLSPPPQSQVVRPYPKRSHRLVGVCPLNVMPR